MPKPFKPGLIPVDPVRFPTLHPALWLTGPRGMCFHRSVALVLDSPAARLCIGTVRAATPEELEAIPEASTEPFIHAWCEIGDVVLPPSLIETFGGRLPSFLRSAYYDKNGVRDVRSVPRAKLLKLAAQYDWFNHLRHHTPIPSSFGTVLLDAAGVAWRPTEAGGVVPA